MLFLMIATSTSTKHYSRLSSGCGSEFVQVIEMGWDIPEVPSYLTSI
jgi:hypothetical protein